MHLVLTSLSLNKVIIVIIIITFSPCVFFLPQALIQPLHTTNDPIISTQHVHIGQPVIGFNPTGVQSASPETSKDIFYDLFYGPLALSILFSRDVFFSAKRSII